MRDGHNVQVYYDANPDMPTVSDPHEAYKNNKHLPMFTGISVSTTFLRVAVGSGAHPEEHA